MCITEYDEEKNKAFEREEGLIEGFARLIRKGKLTEKDAAEAANMSVEEFRRLAALLA